MNNFIKEYFLFINEGVIILAAIIGLFCLRKYRNTVVKYFIYFLVYVVIIELLGYYPRFSRNYDSLNWIQNITKGKVLYLIGFTIFFGLMNLLFMPIYVVVILLTCLLGLFPITLFYSSGSAAVYSQLIKHLKND